MAQADDVSVPLPNVRPAGLEFVPDQKWTTWRLREQRPELVAEVPKTFPDISEIVTEDAWAAHLDNLERDNAEQGREARFRKRSIKHLRKHKPTHLAFRPLYEFYQEAAKIEAKRPGKLRVDEEDILSKIPGFWFDRTSFDLFTRVWEFASNTFGKQNFANRLQDQNWTTKLLRKLPKEFIKYASEIARGDPSIVDPPPNDPNNWEHLFLCNDSRVYLIVGVIAKILDDNVFGSLLFGATPGQKEALERTDRETTILGDCKSHYLPWV